MFVIFLMEINIQKENFVKLIYYMISHFTSFLEGQDIIIG